MLYCVLLTNQQPAIKLYFSNKTVLVTNFKAFGIKTEFIQTKQWWTQVWHLRSHGPSFLKAPSHSLQRKSEMLSSCHILESYLERSVISSKHRNKSWYRGRIWKPQAHAVHNWHRITENTIPSDSQYSKQYNITLKKLYCIGWSSHTFKLWIAQVTLCKISLLAIMFKQIWR